MSIIRHEKNNNFSIMSNECFRNPEISARAKGLYAYIMTLPTDWKLYKTHLHKQFREGRDAINAAFAELEKRGYIHKDYLRDEEGKMIGCDFTVYEHSRLTGNPKLSDGNPVTEKPLDGKPVTTNNLLELKTKELNNTNTSHSPSGSEDKTSAIKSKIFSAVKYDPAAVDLAEMIVASRRRQCPDAKNVNKDLEKTRSAWANDLDKMLRIDKRDPAEAKKVLGWALGDSFWEQNIQSGKKFRDKYDDLKIKMAPAKGPTGMIEI